MSTIRNAYAYSQGRIGGKEASKNIAGDAAESGVRSGGAAMLGTLIRHGAARAGLQTLNKASRLSCQLSARRIPGGPPDTQRTSAPTELLEIVRKDRLVPLTADAALHNA